MDAQHRSDVAVMVTDVAAVYLHAPQPCALVGLALAGLALLVALLALPLGSELAGIAARAARVRARLLHVARAARVRLGAHDSPSSASMAARTTALNSDAE